MLHGWLGLKELRRAIALEAWGNRYAVKALEEILRAYREMLVELVDYALRYKASLETLHETFYTGPRSRYPWLPTSVAGWRGSEDEGDQGKAQAC